MQKYLVTLKAISFSDNRGNFIVREEYVSMSFSCMEWCNKFMSSRKAFYEKEFGMKLVISPIHRESLKVEHIRKVFELVGEYFELEPGEIFKKNRSNRIVFPRWYAMKICADRGLTEHQIADAIGFDHTTVNNGKTGVLNLINQFPERKTEFAMATDFALYAINGRYKEDGSGQKSKK